MNSYRGAHAREKNFTDERIQSLRRHERRLDSMATLTDDHSLLLLSQLRKNRATRKLSWWRRMFSR